MQPIWSLAASLGNIGAAATPVLLAWAMTAAARRLRPAGPIILEASAMMVPVVQAVVHRT